MNGNRGSQSSRETIDPHARRFAQVLGAVVLGVGLLILVCRVLWPRNGNAVLCWICGTFLVVAGLGVAIPQAQIFLIQIFRSLSHTLRKKPPVEGFPAPAEQTPSFPGPAPTRQTLELPHEEAPIPPIGVLWSSVREARQPVFDVLGPTYFLDDTYHFLDWNPAFDELVAKPLELRRGWHAATFVEHLKNVSEVVERSKKVFAPGKVPLIDTEVLEFESEKYGLIKFQKIASQIADERGGIKAWSVNLNILDAENGSGLWQDLEDRKSVV